MKLLMESWRRYLTEDQLLKEERIKKYIVESDIEHLGKDNNFEQLDEEVADWLQDAGHLVLDVLGVGLDFFGPAGAAAGAAADAMNGVWYLTRGCYLYAGLSFLSIAPIIGDALGKGTKIGLFLSKFQTSAKYLKRIQLALSAHAALIDKTFDELERNEKTPDKIRRGVPKMRGAVDTLRTDKESPESCEVGDPPDASDAEKQAESKLQINVEPI